MRGFPPRTQAALYSFFLCEDFGVLSSGLLRVDFLKLPQISPNFLNRPQNYPKKFSPAAGFRAPRFSSIDLKMTLKMTPRLLWFPQNSVNVFKSIPKFPHQKPVPRLRISTNFLKIIQISSSEPCPLVSGFPQISSKTPPYFACGGLSPVPSS